MHDGVQFLQAAVTKSEIGETRAVQPAVGADNFRAEAFTISAKTGWPGSMSVRPRASASMTCAPSSRNIAATVICRCPSRL
jgi:hypothetical protein